MLIDFRSRKRLPHLCGFRPRYVMYNYVFVSSSGQDFCYFFGRQKNRTRVCIDLMCVKTYKSVVQKRKTKSCQRDLKKKKTRDSEKYFVRLILFYGKFPFIRWSSIWFSTSIVILLLTVCINYVYKKIKLQAVSPKTTNISNNIIIRANKKWYDSGNFLQYTPKSSTYFKSWWA